MTPTIQHLRQQIVPVLKKHNIIHASLFGSSIHGTMKKTSDVDLLVQLNANDSLLKYLKIKHELEDVLQRSVDLIEYQSLHKRIKEKVLTEAIPIL